MTAENEPDSELDPPAIDEKLFDEELHDLGMTEAELDAALENLASQGSILSEGGPAIGGGLAQLWEPDPGMVDRVITGTERRLHDRAALLAVVDLVGLGWFTLSALLSDHTRE